MVQLAYRKIDVEPLHRWLLPPAHNRKILGSIPRGSTIWPHSSAGRAPPLHGGCRRFKSCCGHHGVCLCVACTSPKLAATFRRGVSPRLRLVRQSRTLTWPLRRYVTAPHPSDLI